MASSVGDLVVNISADIASLYTGMAQAVDVVGKAADQINRQFSSAAKGVGALTDAIKGVAAAAGAGLSIAGIVAFSESVVGAAAQLERLSIITGSSVESLSQLSNVAQYAGVSFDTVQRLVDRLAAVMGGFAAKSAQAQGALTALGVTARDPVEALQQIADKLNQYADGANKVGLVTAIFGRNAAELIPVLKDLANAHEIAATTSTQQAEAALNLEKQIALLEINATSLKNTVLDNVVPALAEMVSNFNAARAAGLSLWSSLQVGGVDASQVGYYIDQMRAKIPDLAQQLKNLQAAQKDSGADWDLYAAEIVATSNALDDAKKKLQAFEVIQAQAALNRPGFSGPSTFDARDYQAQFKPQAPQPPPAAPKIDYFAQSLGELTKQAALAQQQVDAVFSGQVLTDADKFLATLQSNSKVWDSLNASTKAIIEGTAQYVAQQERASAATVAAATGYADLAKAQAALQQAQSAAAVRVQTEALRQQIDDAKAQYDQGIIDFETYYATITSDQKQSLALQLGQLNDALDAQQAVLAQALQKNLQVANTVGDQLSTGTINWAQAQLTLAKSGADVVNAEVGVAKAQGAVNDAIEQGKTIGTDYIAQWQAANSTILASVQSLNKQIDAQNLANDAIGLTTAQYQQLIIAKDQDQLATLQSISTDGLSADAIKRIQDAIANLQAQIAARGNLAQSLGTGQQLQAIADGWKSLFQSAASEGATFIENFVTKGSSAFKTLWDDFKTWALDAFAKIAAQTVIVNLATAFLPGNVAQAAANTFAGGAGGAASLLTGGANIFSGGSGIFGSLLGGDAGLFGLPTVSAAVANLSIAASAGAEAVGGLTTVFSSLASVAIPVVGIIAAAAAAFGLFGSHGGPKVGGYASSIPGVGFYRSESGAAGDASSQTLLASTQSSYAQTLAALGGTGSAQFALGFDTDPQGTAGNRVSGAATVNGQSIFKQLDVGAGSDSQGLQAGLSLEAQRVILAALQASSLPEYLAHLLDTVSATAGSSADITALLTTAQTVKTLADAFDKALDPSQVTAFTTALTAIDFTKSTDAIKSVAEAAFQILDPAMVSVVDAFQGTDTDLTKFVGTLTSIAAGTAAFGDTLKASIDAALSDGTQATADKVLAFVQILDAGAQSFASIEAPLQNLTATQIPAFIDALGGAANALSAMNYIYTNFTTSTQKTADATATLNADFASLGVAVPQTHQAFLQLLADTDPSSPLYASIVALAPLFIQVHGTADQAATALNNASNALNSAASAAQSLASAWASTKDKAASYASTLTNLGTLSQQAADYGTQLSLAVQLYGDQISKIQAQITSDLAAGNIGDYQYVDQPALAKAQASYNQAVAVLANFTTLSAQYGASQAQQLISLEDWYAQQKKLFSGNSSALTALSTIYQQKWDAIVSGTTAAVGGVQNALASLQQSIADYLKGLMVGALSPLTPQQQIAQAQQAYNQQLGLAQSGDTTALQNITKYADSLLTLERGAYSSSQAYTDIFNMITTQLGDLAGTQQTGAPIGSGVLPTVLNTPVLPAGVAGSLTTVGGVTSGIATSDDIQQLSAALGVRIGDLEQTVATVLANVAASATSDADRIIAGGQSDAVAIVDGLGGSLK